MIRQYVCGGGHTSVSAFFPRPGYEGTSTRSFRKWYATEIYKNSEDKGTVLLSLRRCGQKNRPLVYLSIPVKSLVFRVNGDGSN